MPAFEIFPVEMSDGSDFYEVITPDEYRIAACSSEAACASLVDRLNGALAQWQSEHPDATLCTDGLED